MTKAAGQRVALAGGEESNRKGLASVTPPAQQAFVGELQKSIEKMVDQLGKWHEGDDLEGPVGQLQSGLEAWLKSYKAEELFDKNGTLVPELKALAPKGDRRMSANLHANGGLLRKALHMPNCKDYAIAVTKPGTTTAENTRPLGKCEM